MKKALKMIGIILLILVLVIVTTYMNIKKDIDELAKMDISNVDLSTIDDGTYEGSYKTFPITVVLNVTIKDHKIENIKIIKHDTGKGKRAETITNDVIDNQSIEVDTIAGATYSSKVILKAIEDALESADKD